MQETERRIQETQERERMNLNKVILEEKKWYCGFVAAFSKSLVSSLRPSGGSNNGATKYSKGHVYSIDMRKGISYT